MSALQRQSTLAEIAARGPLDAAPEPRRASADRLPEIFGCKVFNDAVQRRRLPKPVYQALRRTLDTGAELDPSIADAVAAAMKDWAIENGATHYTHWFQPMNGLTAEKHDAFLTPTLEGDAIQEFSGKQLVLGEPDASSLPSGGVRNTFEARGYTGWDPGSPAFLRETEFGSTLTVPTVFVSYTGEALDTKTPLLRSCEAVDAQARRMLELIGETDCAKVASTIGPEQEYFLVDRSLHRLRPDLVYCGRTLLGGRPPKGQELEDHYFSQTPRRILNFMMDLEHTLWELGVPAKTRHGEVAPHQFELAPVFESAAVAIDHNMLCMEVLEDVAERHGFAALLHEKPFAGVNGSGKHMNWSLAKDNGENLLAPGSTPAENQRFMVFLTAAIRAVDLHQDLLRAAIASAGNDHRLGANEAPPAIISVYLGDELQGVVDGILGKPGATAGKGGDLRLGVNTLPPLPIDSSDRNRTSPFAFTGAKFEFRALGSSQSVAFPAMVVNTAVAESLDYLATQIESRGGDRTEAINAVVKETLAAHERILFSGDNYSGDWAAEAERRGLLNLRDTPAALAPVNGAENRAMFERYGVLTERELESRSAVLFSNYVERLKVEAGSLRNLAATSVLPAALDHQRCVAESITATQAAAPDLDLSAQSEHLAAVVTATTGLQRSIEALQSAFTAVDDHAEGQAQANFVRDELVEAMNACRDFADTLEGLVDDALWPLPKYRELLFAH